MPTHFDVQVLDAADEGIAKVMATKGRFNSD